MVHLIICIVSLKYLVIILIKHVMNVFLDLVLDAMDSSGEQHLQMDQNIHKRRLDLNGKPIEEPKKEEISTASSV